MTAPKRALRRDDGELGARPPAVLRVELRRLARVYEGSPTISRDLRILMLDFTARHPDVRVREEAVS